MTTLNLFGATCYFPSERIAVKTKHNSIDIKVVIDTQYQRIGKYRISNESYAYGDSIFNGKNWSLRIQDSTNVSNDPGEVITALFSPFRKAWLSLHDSGYDLNAIEGQCFIDVF